MRHLQITRSHLDGDAGVIGLAYGLADTLFRPEQLSRALASSG
jgi:hypothetical protein